MKTQGFEILLGLKSPSRENTENLDFRNLEDDIKNGILHFNRRHGGYKTISFIKASQKSISIKLTITTDEGIKSPAREVSTLSRYLYNEAGWSIYSAIPNRLFQVLEYTETFEETLNNLFPKVVAQEPLPEQDMSDEQMLKTIEFIVHNQNNGTDETIFRRKNCLNQIKKYILDVM